MNKLHIISSAVITSLLLTNIAHAGFKFQTNERNSQIQIQSMKFKPAVKTQKHQNYYTNWKKLNEGSNSITNQIEKYIFQKEEETIFAFSLDKFAAGGMQMLFTTDTLDIFPEKLRIYTNKSKSFENNNGKYTLTYLGLTNNNEAQLKIEHSDDGNTVIANVEASDEADETIEIPLTNINTGNFSASSNDDESPDS